MRMMAVLVGLLALGVCAPCFGARWTDVTFDAGVVDIEHFDLGGYTYRWDVKFIGGGGAAASAPSNQVNWDKFLVEGPGTDFTAATSELGWRERQDPYWAVTYSAGRDAVQRGDVPLTYSFEATFDGPIDPARAAIHLRYGGQSGYVTGHTSEPAVVALLALGVPLALCAHRRRRSA